MKITMGNYIVERMPKLQEILMFTINFSRLNKLFIQNALNLIRYNHQEIKIAWRLTTRMQIMPTVLVTGRLNDKITLMGKSMISLNFSSEGLNQLES